MEYFNQIQLKFTYYSGHNHFKSTIPIHHALYRRRFVCMWVNQKVLNAILYTRGMLFLLVVSYEVIYMQTADSWSVI